MTAHTNPAPYDHGHDDAAAPPTHVGHGHALNPHANAACELAAEHQAPWAMASWALAGGRVEGNDALLQAAHSHPAYSGR